MSFEKEIEHYTTKILSSRYFSSGNDVRLLKYLIDATQKGQPLKETIIAMEVFGKDATWSPSEDSLVRSSVYGLRKKLDIYYLDEGKDDRIKISIPKGSYNVKFQKIEQPSPEGKKYWKLAYRVFFVILIIFCGFVSYLYYTTKQKIDSIRKTDPENYIWTDFIQSDDPVMIVLGDYFMIENENSPNSYSYFSHKPGINSERDLWSYLEKDPEGSNFFSGPRHHLLGEEIPWCLQEISDVFRGYDTDISVKLSSELSFEDIRGHHIIFIGDYSTLGIFKPFFDNSHYRIENHPPSITYLEDRKDTTETISIRIIDNTTFQNDYVLISKQRGSEDRVLLFILSFTSFGKSDAMYKLTDPEFADELKVYYDPLPDFWELLIRVSGIEKSGFYYEISHFNKLD